MSSDSTDKHKRSTVEPSSSSDSVEPSSPAPQNNQESVPEQPKAKKNAKEKVKEFVSNSRAGFEEAEAERKKKAQGKKGSGNAHVAALEQGEEGFEKMAWNMATLGYKTDVAALQFAGKKLQDLYHRFRAEKEKTPEEHRAIDEELEQRASQGMPGEEEGIELPEWRPSPSASSNDDSEEEAIANDREDAVTEEMEVDDGESAATDPESVSDVELTPIEDKPEGKIDEDEVDPLAGIKIKS